MQLKHKDKLKSWWNKELHLENKVGCGYKSPWNVQLQFYVLIHMWSSLPFKIAFPKITKIKNQCSKLKQYIGDWNMSCYAESKSALWITYSRRKHFPREKESTPKISSPSQSLTALWRPSMQTWAFCSQNFPKTPVLSDLEVVSFIILQLQVSKPPLGFFQAR